MAERKTIRIGGVYYSRADLRKYPDIVRSARIKEIKMVCVCAGKEIPLCYREINGVVIVVCAPNTASLHAQDCEMSCHYEYRAERAASMVTIPCLYVVGGELRFNLRQKFEGSRRPLRGSIRSNRNYTGRARTPRVNHGTIVGMLLHLLDLAGLTTHLPGQHDRSWEDVSLKIEDVLARATNAGIPMLDLVMMPTGNNEDRLKWQKQDIAQYLGDTSIKYRLVVGEIEQVSTVGKETQVKLTGWDEQVYFSAQQWSSTKRRSWSANARSVPSNGVIAGESGRYLLVTMVEVDYMGKVRATGGRIVATTEQWMPVQSSYELAMANHLCSGPHKVIKPLWPTDDEPRVPDFIVVISEERQIYIEVAGMRGNMQYDYTLWEKEYEYRRRLKEYRIWEPGMPMPSLW